MQEYGRAAKRSATALTGSGPRDVVRQVGMLHDRIRSLLTHSVLVRNVFNFSVILPYCFILFFKIVL